MLGLPTDANPCLPSLGSLIHANTDDAAFVCAWNLGVSSVLEPRNVSQVHNRVVRFSAIYVINVLLRPFAVIKTPSDPMGQILTIKDTTRQITITCIGDESGPA
jgi:hypothetical protein